MPYTITQYGGYKRPTVQFGGTFVVIGAATTIENGYIARPPLRYEPETRQWVELGNITVTTPTELSGEGWRGDPVQQWVVAVAVDKNIMPACP